MLHSQILTFRIIFIYKRASGVTYALKEKMVGSCSLVLLLEMCPLKRANEAPYWRASKEYLNI